MILTGMWLSAAWVVLGHCSKICGDGGIQNKDVEALWEFLHTIVSYLSHLLWEKFFAYE